MKGNGNNKKNDESQETFQSSFNRKDNSRVLK